MAPLSRKNPTKNGRARAEDPRAIGETALGLFTQPQHHVSYHAPLSFGEGPGVRLKEIACDSLIFYRPERIFFGPDSYYGFCTEKCSIAAQVH
jgi:hypothetical protein